MKWLLFHQSPTGDSIKYIDSESLKYHHMGYKDFLNKLKTVFIKDKLELIKSIEYFETILLHLDTGDWEIKKMKIDNKKYTFEELYVLNKPVEEDEEDILSKSKKFLKDFLNNNKGSGTWMK